MSKFRTVIDLTRKAQKERAQPTSMLREPEPALPAVDIDGLPDALAAAVKRMGWPGLTPVQAKAIPYLLDGRDIIAQSRTGTGKTGGFVLPLFELLDPAEKGVKALILAPTRELARQVDAAFREMSGEGDDAIKTALIYGGVGYAPQIKALKDGAQVVIGTPGRILDLIQGRNLILDGLKMLVLDEADEMLSMGFYPDMVELSRYLPADRVSCMFSATMPYKVQLLAESFLRNPGFLSLSVDSVHVDSMSHRYTILGPMEKDRAMISLIEYHNPDSAIIFCNTKKKVDYLAQFLSNHGYSAQGLSGDMNQKVRERVMAGIQDGKTRLMVATDIAARGIDISDLSHVFNYDVPQDPEYYVHRAGRTARAGKTGMALTLATRLDKHILVSIGKEYEIEFEVKDIPSDEDVRSRKQERAIQLLEAALRKHDRPEEIELLTPFALELARSEGDPSMSMLLNEMYYHTVLEDEPRDIEPSEILKTVLFAASSRSKLYLQRLEDFEPLVLSLADEEPELLGLLLSLAPALLQRQKEIMQAVPSSSGDAGQHSRRGRPGGDKGRRGGGDNRRRGGGDKGRRGGGRR